MLKKLNSDPVSELNDSKIIYDSIQLMISEHDAIFQEAAFERDKIRRQRVQEQVIALISYLLY